MPFFLDTKTLTKIHAEGFVVVRREPSEVQLKVGAPFCFNPAGPQTGDGWEVAKLDARDCYLAMIALGKP